MQKQKGWRIAFVVLSVVFVCTAVLNMLRVRAGFLTEHTADLVVPAWLYIAGRELYSPSRRGMLMHRTIGRTPARAALILFSASALSELSQRYWPHGIFAGRFDVLDIVAYGLALTICYAADRLTAETTLRGSHAAHPAA